MATGITHNMGAYCDQWINLLGCPSCGHVVARLFATSNALVEECVKCDATWLSGDRASRKCVLCESSPCRCSALDFADEGD